MLLYSYEAPAKNFDQGVKDIKTTIPIQENQR